MITAFLGDNHREWNEHIAEFRFAYNTAFHTFAGNNPRVSQSWPRTPAVGRERQEDGIAIDETDTEEWRERMEKVKSLHEWVIENLNSAHEKQARYYNLRRRDRRFAIGDLVLKRQHVLTSAAGDIDEVSAKFHGPFTISRILSPVMYELRDSANREIEKIYIKDLKAYVPNPAR